MFEARLNRIQSEAQSLYEGISGQPSPEIKVVVDPDYISAAADTNSSTIHINPHFLLSEKEVKKHYPHLKNPFYQALSTKPALAEKTKRFTLAHEVAHLYYNHKHNVWDHYLSIFTMAPASLILSPSMTFWPLIFSLILVKKIAAMIFRPLRQLSERYMEHQADLAAVKVIGDLQGFRWFCTIAEVLKSRSWAHPPPLKRLEYVESHV